MFMQMRSKYIPDILRGTVTKYVKQTNNSANILKFIMYQI